MAIYMWREMPDYLCFTANTAGSTIVLNKGEYASNITLETSTDGNTWNTYSFGNTITLSSIGDKVYWRNTSETDTGFSTDKYSSNMFSFSMTGSINGSGDINFLLNKNSTTTVSDYCFYQLFMSCSALKTTPKLPATTLGQYCYYGMFYSCSGITSIPKLPALNLPTCCYQSMFAYTGKTLSATETAECIYEYRIPTEGTGTAGTMSLYGMFPFGVTTPSVNTTYYANVPSV